MLRKIKAWFDRGLEFFTAISMGVLVVDVTWQVVTRFILKNPSDWTEELATYLMIWVGVLGAAVAFSRGAHLGIDYFTAKMKVKMQKVVELFVLICVFTFSVVVLLYGGIQLVIGTFASGQTSPALTLPMGYVYLAIPVSGFFICIYSVEFFIEALQKLKSS